MEGPLGQPLGVRREQDAQPHRFNWVDIQLRLATKNEFVSLEILRYLYVTPAEPVLFMILLKQFRARRLCSNRSTVWKHCRRLEEMQLTKLLHGNPISVWPARSVDPENVKLLLNRCYRSLLGDHYRD